MTVEIGKRFQPKPGILRCTDTGHFWERLPAIESPTELQVQRALLLPLTPRVAERVQAIQSLRRLPR